MRILIAEDDLHIREGLADLLQGEGYETVTAEDGEQALALFAAQQPDLLMLDIMMPKLTGYDVCREVRRDDPLVPIIFVSAKSEEIDRVLGLELGADDYIMKPFGVREVVARVRAVTRRTQQPAGSRNESERFQMGPLTIDTSKLRVTHTSGEYTDISPRDLKILSLLHQKADQVVSREELYNHGWGRQYLPSSRTLDQHISQLRKRIELGEGAELVISTVHGVGYRYDSERLEC